MNHKNFNLDKNLSLFIVCLLLLFIVRNASARKLKYNENLAVKVEWKGKNYNLDFNRLLIKNNCRQIADKK